MDNSILNSIKKWKEEYNYPFNCIIYKIDKNFPKAFQDTIVNYIKSVRPTGAKINEIKEFAVVFTPDKQVYLEFLDGISRVIIIEDFTEYTTLPPAKVVRESTFLADIKTLDKERLDKFISTMPEEYARRFSETVNLDDITRNVTKNIIEYGEYLTEESKKCIEKIFFNEADSVKNSVQTSHNSNQSYARKNKEISFEERKNILDSYKSEYEFEAQARNSKSTYSVKVYKVKNIKYKIVMEPKEGTKYTKVVHINKENLSLSEARTIVIDSLQLDRNEISQSDNITRHSHTDLEEYKKLLEYLITKNYTSVNYTTRKKIEEAENAKKR